MKKQLAIIACGVMKREIESVLGPHLDRYSVSYLSPAPCIDYSLLRRQLQLLLKRASEQAEKILVVIGRCHPDMDEILAQYGAHRANINDCFHALLGGEREQLESEAKTFFTTAAWLDHWKRAFATGMKWDEVDARQNMGRNDRVILLDTRVTPISDEKVLEYFDFVQLPVEVKEVDLTVFKESLLKEINGLGA